MSQAEVLFGGSIYLLIQGLLLKTQSILNRKEITDRTGRPAKFFDTLRVTSNGCVSILCDRYPRVNLGAMDSKKCLLKGYFVGK